MCAYKQRRMLLAPNKLRPALEHSWFALTDENPLLARLAETDLKRSAFFFAISLLIWSAAGMNAVLIRAESSESLSGSVKTQQSE